MALSLSQKNENQFQLDTIRVNPLYLKQVEDRHIDKIIPIILEACDHQGIILNTDLKLGIDRLIALMHNYQQKMAFDEAAFRKAAQQWAQYYQQLTAEAGMVQVAMSAKQPPGILRGLREQKKLLPEVWCEDSDIHEALRGVMVRPDQVAGSGVFILSPIDLESMSFLVNQLQTVLSNNPLGNLRLLTPVAFKGHWRLAKVDVVDGQMVQAGLWDSMDNPNLSVHEAFVNMQKALDQVQSANKILLIPQAAAIQKNGWSCADFVMQEALSEKKESSTPHLVTIRDAKTPETLRKAVVQAVVRDHPDVEAYLPKDVKEEKEEKIVAVKVNEASLFAHLSKVDNRSLQNKFDAKMAKELEALYKKYPDEQNEAKLVEMARNAAYGKMARKLKGM